MSDEKHQPYGTDKLVAAYDRMMHRTHEFVEKSFQEPLNKAVETAVELGELTRDEAERVAMYLKRDLQETAHHLSESRRELRDWFRFDLEQIENRMLETFSKLVDHSRIELARMSGKLDIEEPRHTGEVAGIGTLVCAECAKQLHFLETGRIPPCPKCHGTVFTLAKPE